MILYRLNISKSMWIGCPGGLWISTAKAKPRIARLSKPADTRRGPLWPTSCFYSHAGCPCLSRMTQFGTFTCKDSFS
ncbi:Hypothetical predicted protein [Olea europaea subsp. europaea]|uniref:Uncharacterized protein n=1 Tax=Olea europaea subsp. europaea TaxID=158383 RepID=A0A8S0TK10_OLEEU|nr:Hypothetical predicted protein [Olea europaea subsp. europaea]